ADVAVRGGDLVVLAEVLRDGLRLGWRFNDDELRDGSGQSLRVRTREGGGGWRGSSSGSIERAEPIVLIQRMAILDPLAGQPNHRGLRQGFRILSRQPDNRYAAIGNSFGVDHCLRRCTPKLRRVRTRERFTLGARQLDAQTISYGNRSRERDQRR